MVNTEQRRALIAGHADVAARYHGLVGEGLEQGNLPLREKLSFGTAKVDRGDRETFSHHGHAQ